jgi:hypothetical protein
MTATPSESSMLDSSLDNPQIHIEEMACAIAEAQSSLLAGRYNELEICAWRLQQLCASLKLALKKQPKTGRNNLSTDIAAARRAHHQSRVLGSTLSRMRRHLAILRNLLNGPSATYQPKIIPMPERKN